MSTLAALLVASVASVASIEPSITCSLPHDTIARVVRDARSRFRHCYALALTRRPTLEGRIATRFVIASDGAIESAADAGSDVGDPALVACFVETFRDLDFRNAVEGRAVVVYPFTLTRAEDAGASATADADRRVMSSPRRPVLPRLRGVP